MQKNFDRKIKEMQPFVFDKACAFIREQTMATQKMLTRQHHSILQQFLDWKERTYWKIRQADRQAARLGELENRLSSKTPVLEAENAVDDRTALSMYDCLIPRLKEHRRFKIFKDSIMTTADFQAIQAVREIERELKIAQLPSVKAELQIEKKKTTQLKEEFDVIQWYITLFEDGKDSKEVIEEYYELREIHEQYVKNSEKRIDALEIELSRTLLELDEAMSQLKKQQEKVVKPLIEEVTKREVENIKLREQLRDRTKSLKIMFSMLRSPKLCELVYKTERRKYTDEKLKEMQREHTFLLRKYKFDPNNAQKFVEGIYDDVQQ